MFTPTRLPPSASVEGGVSGKVRHLAVADLWIQDRIRKDDFTIDQILDTENPNDMLTKHVSRDLISKHMVTLGLKYEDSRAESAATIP